MLTVYGLKNCDSCRRALKWLAAEGIAFTFRDLRAEPPSEAQWTAWLAELGHDALLNRRGTTWRGLSEADKDAVDAAKATQLLSNHPALMKRPLFDFGDKRILGFGAAQQDAVRASAEA